MDSSRFKHGIIHSKGGIYMNPTTHISFEELAGNLADVLNKVREEHTPVVVEYATGEKVMIQPLPAPKKRNRRKKAFHYDANKVKAAILKNAGSWRDIETDSLIAML